MKTYADFFNTMRYFSKATIYGDTIDDVFSKTSFD